MTARKLRILLILTSFYACVNAQSAFVKAYIVNLKGDTVRGTARVNPKKEYDNFDHVSFKEGNGPQKSYDPDKILAYGFEGHEFVVMEADGENVFFRVLEKGPINLYKQMFPGFRMNKLSWETEYYISNRENPKPVLLKESKVKKQLLQWMEDKPEYINKYNEEAGFDLDATLEIIKKYNNWKRNSGT